MSHTVHPYSHRLGILRDWKSRWFGDGKKYRQNLKADTLIRKFVVDKLEGMYVASVEIERNKKTFRIIVQSSRPGLIIGRSGEGADSLRKAVEKFMKKHDLQEEDAGLKIDIEEVKSPESNAMIVALQIKEMLEKRMAFRRVMKQTVEKVMANRDVEGVRISLGGRLGGADMARKEEIKRGRVPLQTLRADIDFARVEANLPYGVIGIKVWIYRGEVFADRKAGQVDQEARSSHPSN
jgi:small subunit ribosomal protein S3